MHAHSVLLLHCVAVIRRSLYFRGDLLRSSSSITVVCPIHNGTRTSLPFVCFGIACFPSHPDVIYRMSVVIWIEDDPNRYCFLLIVLHFLIVLV